jgi:ADP-L-glycero-D-manno-heptose 6-epimerase
MSRPLVLVTGGAGFIGSNIVAALTEAEYDVAVCDRLRAADSGKWRNIAKHPIVDFIHPDGLMEWLKARGEGVEAIVHMGAISSTIEPDADLIAHSNFGLSRDLWNWAAERDRRLIYASSAATYGDGLSGFEDADDYASLRKLRPMNAYGWSKALFDLYARREADRGHAPAQWAGLKFFNVYGPNEGHKSAMRSVVCQKWPEAARGDTVKLFKSYRDDVPHGGQRRDFVYVRDAVEVVMWLLANPQVNGIYNLGTGRARTFRELVEALFRAADKPLRVDYVDMPTGLRDKYQYFTEAQMGRLKAAGYDRPFTPIEDGVADYVWLYLSQADPHR